MFCNFSVTMDPLNNDMNRCKFQWLPERCLFVIKENYNNDTNLISLDHHLIKYLRVVTLDDLTSTGIYFILISKAQNKTSSNIYVENLYNDYDINYTAIYMLPNLVKYNSFM